MAYASKEVCRQHYRKVADHKRKVLARWKLRKGCVDCGYNSHSDALEFDHRPGTKGPKTVASMMYGSWNEIKTELTKCDIRCANCHAIQTFVRKRAAGGTADTAGLDPAAL